MLADECADCSPRARPYAKSLAWIIAHKPHNNPARSCGHDPHLPSQESGLEREIVQDDVSCCK